MARFRFRLEPVLKVRKTREEEALRVLAATQREYQQRLARKAELLADLERALLRREGLGASAVPIDAFRVEQSFINGTKQRLIQSDQAIFRASKQVEKALRAFLIARKQCRMLETLREKDYRAFRKEQARLERKRLDDFTVMRFRLLEEERAS
jgi:flagellar FliJ protein